MRIMSCLHPVFLSCNTLPMTNPNDLPRLTWFDSDSSMFIGKNLNPWTHEPMPCQRPTQKQFLSFWADFMDWQFELDAPLFTGECEIHVRIKVLLFLYAPPISLPCLLRCYVLFSFCISTDLSKWVHPNTTKSHWAQPFLTTQL